MKFQAIVSPPSIYQSSNSVPRKKSPVKTDGIIMRVEIVGPEFREFVLSCGEDRYKKLAWKCVDMDMSCHTYFQVKGKIFVMHCY